MKQITPTLDSVRDEFVCRLYCLARTLDLQVYPGAGASMLGLDPSLEVGEWPSYSDFQLDFGGFAESLNIVYRYAFYGEQDTHIFSDEIEEGDLGRLAAIADLVSESSVVARNFDDVTEVHGIPWEDGSNYRTMIKLAKARHQLDTCRDVSLGDIAVLLSIDERTVRNALYETGESMLVAFREENIFRAGESELRVKKFEALRWMRLRNFIDTKRLHSVGELPAVALGTARLMPFLRERLAEFFSSEHGETPEEILDYRYDCAGGSIGLTGEATRRLFERPIKKLTGEDCYLIAQMIYLDFKWLRKQVEDATGKTLTISESKIKATMPPRATSPLDEAAGTLEIELTDAGIRNGYFNIDRRYAERFFPSDVYGDRGAGQTGHSIALHHDSRGSPYITDLRVKSDIWVSPRKRFSAYFTAHNSKAGDRIQFKKTGERSFELIYLGQ